MNNDFNYRPSQPKPQQDPAQPAEPAQATEATDPTGSTQPSVSSPIITSGGKGSGGLKKFLAFLGVLVLLAAAAGGVYYWQHSKVKSLQATQASLQNQVATLKSASSKQTNMQGMSGGAMTQNSGNSAVSGSMPAMGSTDVITASPSNITANSALASVQYSAKATQVWVESGTQPDQLTMVSNKVAPSAGSDVQNFQLTGLKPATRYYYRAAGMVNGMTMYGGVVMFTTTK